MSHNTEEKPAFITGFLWFAFSGTAMLSAFILPIHIWAISHGYTMNLGNIFFRLYFVVLFVCALYHGLYRTKTILFDLGLGRHKKPIMIITGALFILFTFAIIQMLLL